MILLKRLFFIFSGIVFFSINIYAADYYWVGGSGNWSETSHWATSSGGTAFHTQIPTAADDVYFDTNSGLEGGTVTLTANSVCADMNWTGAGNVIFERSTRTLVISGSLTTNASVTFSGTGAISFNGAGSHTIEGPLILTSGTTNLLFYFSGTGGYTLKDLVINSGRPITFYLRGTGSYILENLNLTSAAGGTFIFTGTGAYTVKSPVVSSTALTFATETGGSYILPDELEIYTGGNLAFNGNFTNESAFRKLEKTGTGTVIFTSTGNLTLSDDLELNSTGHITFNGNYTTAQPLRQVKNTGTTTLTFGATGIYTVSNELNFDCPGSITLNGGFTTPLPIEKVTNAAAGAVTFNASSPGSYDLSDIIELDCTGTVTFNGNYTTPLPIEKIIKTSGTFTFSSTTSNYALAEELEVVCPGAITFGNKFTTPNPLKKIIKESGTLTFSSTGDYTLAEELELACAGTVTFNNSFTTPVPIKKVTNTAAGAVTFNASGSGSYDLSNIIELDCAGTVTFNGSYTTPLPIEKIIKTSGAFTFSSTTSNYELAEELEVVCPAAITFGGKFTTPDPLKKITKASGNLTFSSTDPYTLAEELELNCAGTVTFNNHFTTLSPFKKITNELSGAVSFAATGTYTLAENVVLATTGTITFSGKPDMLTSFRNMTNEKTGAVTFSIDITGAGHYIPNNLNFSNSGAVSVGFTNSSDASDYVTISGRISNTKALTLNGGTTGNRVDVNITGTVETTNGGTLALAGHNNYEVPGSLSNNGSITISTSGTVNIRGDLVTAGGNYSASLSGAGNYTVEGDIKSNYNTVFSGAGNYAIEGGISNVYDLSCSGTCNLTVDGPVTGRIFTFSGTGTYKFNNSLTLTGYIRFSNGKLDISGQTVSTTYFNGSAAAATASLNIAGATVTLTGTTATTGYWVFTGGEAIPAENSENSLIKVNSYFTGKDGDWYGTVEAGTGLLAYGNFQKILVNKTTGMLNADGGVIHVDELEYSVAGGFSIGAGSTIHIQDKIHKTDDELSVIKAASTATIHMGVSSTVEMDAVGLQNIMITGPDADYPTFHGYDMGGNSGWLFTDPLPVDMNAYFWRGGLRDGVFDNINNWELGFPGSGITPADIFGTSNDIHFPPNGDNPATMTLKTENSVGGAFFNRLYYYAIQSLTLNMNAMNHTGSKMFINNGSLTLTGTNSLTVTDSLCVASRGKLTRNATGATYSFGSTVIDGNITTSATTSTVTIFKDITIHSGGVLNATVTGNSANFTIGNTGTGGDLKINDDGQAIFKNTGNGSLHFCGNIIDPNGGLSITGFGVVHASYGVFFESPVAYTLDLGGPTMPGITGSRLVFNSPSGYSMNTPFDIPTNSIDFGVNCGGFSTNGHDITCKDFMLLNTTATSGTIIDLEGSTITLQRLVNSASSNARQWDVKASTTHLIFEHPSEHYLEYAQNLHFGSIRFSGTAPLARIYLTRYWLSNAQLSVNNLISDVNQISLESYVSTANNVKVNVLSSLDIMQPCDIYPGNNGVANTYTLSVGGITEHPDACHTKSKVFSEGLTQMVFNTTAALTSSHIAFNGIQFTGESLTTSKLNDLGGNSGTVTWTDDSETGQTFYWIGGNGYWHDTRNWALSPGGTEPIACLPSDIDDVVFDCNSFTEAGQTVTIDAGSGAAAVNNVTWDSELITCGKQGRLDGAQLLIAGSADFRGAASVNAPLVLTSSSEHAGFITGENTGFSETVTFQHNGVYSITGPLFSTSDIIHSSGGIICHNDSISCRRFDSRSLNTDAAPRWLDFTDAKITVRHVTVNSDNVFYLHLENFDLEKSTFAGSHIYTQNGSALRVAGASSTNQKTVTFHDLSATGAIYSVAYLTIHFNDVDLHPVDLNQKIIHPFTCRNLFMKSGRTYQFYRNTGTPAFVINGDFTTDAGNCTPLTTIGGNSTTATIVNKVNDPFYILRAKITNINATGQTLVVADGEDGGNNTNISFDGEVTGNKFYWVGGTGNWNDPEHWSIGVSGGNPDGCIPGRYDDVFFDGNSFTDMNQRVTLDQSNQNCRNMLWTSEAGTKAPQLYALNYSGYALNIYGSLDLTEGMKIQCPDARGLLINMLGTSREKNAQYIRFNGFNNTTASERYFRFSLSGGGRYDLADDMLCRIYSNNQPSISIAANSSFYSNGYDILCRNITIANTANTTDCTVDLSGSTIDMDYSFSATIDSRRTFIADGSHILLSANTATITNNSGADLHFHNIRMGTATNTTTITTATSDASKPVVFNKIEWLGNSNLAGAATIITDTLEYARSTSNTILENKKVVVNKRLIASGTPCGAIMLQSSSTTPAILSSGNCDMTVSFGKLSYITADVSNGCDASAYKLTGRAGEQVEAINWTVTNTEGEQLNLFEEDLVIGCSHLPYVQRTDGFGVGDFYEWKYRATADDPWTNYKSGTYEEGADTIHITQPGYFQLSVDYGGATCSIFGAELGVTVIDTIAPSIMCNVAGSATVSAYNGVYQISGTQFDAVATDTEDCPGVNPGIEVWYTLSGATVKGKTATPTLAGETLHPGITTVKWFVSDHPMPEPNIDSCSFEVIVLPEPPTLSASFIQTCATGNTTPVTVTIANATTGFTYVVYDQAAGGNRITGKTAENDGALDILLEMADGGTYHIETEYQGLVSESRTVVTIELNGPAFFTVETVDDELCSGEDGITIVNLRIPDSDENYRYAVFSSATGTDTLMQRTGNGSDLDFTINLQTTGVQTLYVSATDMLTGCSNTGGRVPRQYTIHPLPAAFTVAPASQEYCLSGGTTEVELVISGAEAGNTYYVMYSGSESILAQETATGETLTIRFNETTTDVKNYTLYAETPDGCKTPVEQRVTTAIIVNTKPGNDVAWISWINRDDNKTFEICGDPQQFSVEFNHRLGYCTLPDTTLVLELAPGIEYVPGSLVLMSGSAEVTEHKVDDLNKPVFWVSSISGGQNVGFYYSAVATMDAFDLFYDNTNVPDRKFTYQYGQLPVNVTEITGFQGQWGDIRITEPANTTITVNPGETFTVNVKAKNIGNGSVEMLVLDFSGYLPDLLLTSTDKGILENNRITLEKADLPGESLGAEEEVAVSIELQAGSCAPGTIDNSIKALWGCGSMRQSDAYAFTVIVNSGVPNLEYKIGNNRAPRDDWEGISNDTIYIINIGEGVASEVTIELRQTRGQQTYSNTNFGEFNPNSIRVQKGKNGTPQQRTAKATYLYNSSNNRRFFPYGGITGMDVEFPFNVNPRDTVIFIFSEGFIDLTAYNSDPTRTLTNAYRRGWGFEATYSVPCTGATVRDNDDGKLMWGRKSTEGSYLNNGVEIAAYSEGSISFTADPGTLTDTENQGQLSFVRGSFINVAFINPTGAYVDIVITHPKGITLSNPVLKTNGSVNRTLINQEQKDETTFIARYNWGQTWTGNATFTVDFDFDCSVYREAYPRGSELYDGFKFGFQYIAYKSETTQGIPSVILESETVSVDCYDPNTVGIVSEQFIAERFNVSPFSDDHVSPSHPDRKKFWYGDTLLTRYTGSVKTDLTDHRQWEYVTVQQEVPVPVATNSDQKIVEVTARVKRADNNSVTNLVLMKDQNILVAGSVIETTISGGKRYIVNLSADNFGGRTFQEGDSVTIETKIRYLRTGGIENMEIAAEFYASHTLNPSDNLDKYSGSNKLASPLTAYYIRFLRNDTGVDFNGCNEVELSRSFTVLMNSSIVGSSWNFFTDEFREIGQVRRIYVKKPAGYVLKDNRIKAAIVALNSPKTYNMTARDFTATGEGDSWMIDLGPLYESGVIKPEDETFTVEMNYTLIPGCTTPPGTVIHEISIDFLGSMPQYPNITKILVSASYDSDYLGYYPPVLAHTGGGSASQTDLTNGKVSWPVFISNTSTRTDAPKVWMTAPMPPSDPTIRIDSVMYGNVKYLPDAGGFFDLGTLPLGSTREFKVCGTLLDCSADPAIDLYYYWTCDALPSSLNDVECMNTVNLSVQAPKGELITTFTDISGVVTHCQPISYSLSLTNNLDAPLKDLQVIFDQMPNGLSYVDGSLEYSVGTSGTYTPAPASAITMDGGKIIFDISGIGVISLSRDVVHLRYDLITTQGFISGSKYQVEVIGRQWCGEAIRSNIIVPVSIYLSGVTEPPFRMSVEITPLTIATCTQDVFTLKTSVKLIDGTSTDLNNINNEVILDLPIGLDFVEVPAGVGNNNSLGTANVEQLPDGSYRVRWDMPVFTTNMQHNYEFRVRQATSLECADINRIVFTAAIVEEVLCEGVSSEIFIITGEASSDITLDKPQIEVLEILKSETTPDCDTNESRTYTRIRLQNNGKAIPAGTPMVIEIFSAIEDDGTFDAANLLGHYTATTGMAAGARLLLDVRISYPSSMMPDLNNPLYSVIRTKAADTSPAQCVCDPSYKSFTTTETSFPAITLSVNGSNVCEGEETVATATQVTGYTYEWSINPDQGGLMTANEHRTNILWNGITFPSGETQITRTLNLTVTDPDTGCYREFSEPITINYRTRSGEIYRLPNN